MKKYINLILITSILFLIFPFLGFPELWENFYVIILGFITGTSALFLRYKSGLVTDTDDETSLQDYVKELQDKFKEQVGQDEHQKNSSRISDVTINHD
jgi:uncharacterized membrane protein (DUF106 family)